MFSVRFGDVWLRRRADTGFYRHDAATGALLEHIAGPGVFDSVYRVVEAPDGTLIYSTFSSVRRFDPATATDTLIASIPFFPTALALRDIL